MAATRPYLPRISLFSKCLHGLDVPALARVASEIGYDGIDLTVRRGGHVEPERVEQDLPPAVEAIRRAGLDIPMISTDIVDADNPLTERVLRTAAALGIANYRMSALYYSVKPDLPADLARFESVVHKLARLSEKHRIVCTIQNHSLDNDFGVQFGHYFTSMIWDLASVLKSVNSPWVGSQYDIGHASIECSRSWAIGLELLSPYIKALQIKDFVWAQRGPLWEPQAVPVGQGMVDYPRFMGIVRQKQLDVPVILYVGYDMRALAHGVDPQAMRDELTRIRKLARGPA